MYLEAICYEFGGDVRVAREAWKAEPDEQIIRVIPNVGQRESQGMCQTPDCPLAETIFCSTKVLFTLPSRSIVTITGRVAGKRLERFDFLH